MACGILVPSQGLVRPMTVKALDPNHWTSVEIPDSAFLLNFEMMLMLFDTDHILNSIDIGTSLWFEVGDTTEDAEK